jgi:hypothetical protein
MSESFLVAPLVILCFLGGQKASANTVYTYTGTPFQQAVGTLATTNFITLSLDLPQPLPANLDNATLTNYFGNPSSGTTWSMSDGHDTLSSQNPIDMLFVSMLYTNSSGEITAWYIGSNEHDPALNGAVSVVMETFEEPGCPPICSGTDSAGEYGPVYYQGSLIATQQIGAASTTSGPGAWSMITVNSESPEPSTWVMLLLPLLAFFGWTSARKHCRSSQA